MQHRARTTDCTNLQAVTLRQGEHCGSVVPRLERQAIPGHFGP